VVRTHQDQAGEENDRQSHQSWRTLGEEWFGVVFDDRAPLNAFQIRFSSWIYS